MTGTQTFHRLQSLIRNMLILVGALLLASNLAPNSARAESTVSEDGLVEGESLVYSSKILEGDVTVLPGVFHPKKADKVLLPFMEAHKPLFKGKRVLEIGAGSGVVSLYAAALGASNVVATDIDAAAIETIERNAGNRRITTVLEARAVPADNPSAYSVIKPDEIFDVIVSYPPDSLILGATGGSPVIDNGNLGFSIIRGLEKHLAREGVAILLYDSTFYHQVIVKFARYSGYTVRNHDAGGLTPYEAEAIYNAYLAQVLESQGLEPEVLRFDRKIDAVLVDSALRRRTSHLKAEPLLPGMSASNRWRAGLIVIRHKQRN